MKPKGTGWGVVLGTLGLGFGVAAIAATAAWQAGWLPGSRRSPATKAPPPEVRPAPAASSPVAAAASQVTVPQARPAPASSSAKTPATLRAMIAGSHSWSVSRAQNGHTAPAPVSCTTDAGKFSCSGYCGTNAGKMLLSADGSKVTLVFLVYCEHKKRKLAEYDVESFEPTRFRLRGPKDWQEWVLED